MDYYLYLNDEQKGPYTVSQLQSMWRSGSITGNTLYWQEGSPDWVPLSSILHILEPPIATPVPIAPQPLAKQTPVSAQAPAPKPAQSPIVTFGCLFIFGVVGLAVYLSSTSGTSSSSSSYTPSSISSTPSSQSSASSDTGEFISSGFIGRAETLYDKYDANEVAADGQYKGKLATVSGSVKDIGKDILDQPYVVLGGRGFLNGVQCTFARGDTTAASLYKGQSVTICGRVSGKMGNVQLSDCSLR